MREVNSLNSEWNENIRLIIMADHHMDWSSRLTIASARIKAGFKGEIILIGECLHPVFDNEMRVQFHSWKELESDLLPITPWGGFRKAHNKPILIKKFFSEPTIYLDADTFCRKSFTDIIENTDRWSCSVTRDNCKILSDVDMRLWGISHPPVQQLNSGVIVFKDQSIIDSWCSVFEEAIHDKVKYEYLIHGQSWLYDQIGLIIAYARTGIQFNILDQKYNFKVAEKGWPGAEKASIIHFTNWKVKNHHEALCLTNNAPSWLGVDEIASIVQEVEVKEKDQPAIATVKNSIKSKRASGLVRNVSRKRLIVGISQGIGNIIFATPLLIALIEMGWKIDIPAGVFNNGSESVLNGLGITIADKRTIGKHAPYMAALQGAWPVRGIERLACQTLYAPPFQQSWQQNLFLHEVEANMSLAYAMSYKGDIPSVYCHRSMCGQTRQLSSMDDLLVGLHICTNYKSQLFANRRLRNPERVAAALNRQGWKVVLIGAPGTSVDIAVYPENTINLVGKLNLSQTADAIARLDALVTEDCGITHVAAAMDCPQVSIFGPTHVIKSRPWSDKAYVLTSNIECQPCQFVNNGQSCQDNRCMAIAPEVIVHHVNRLLKQFSNKNECKLSPQNPLRFNNEKVNA